MHQSQLTTDFWSRLPGIRLGGIHELREWIGDDGTHRYFGTNAVGEIPAGAIIAVVAGEEKLLENQLSQWNLARRFVHPNLVRVYETGYDEVEGQALVYAVMERPDEDLGSVTLGRALTAAETTDVARALIAALGYLHQQGFVHGNVDPFSIVAIGDSIKLVTHDAAPAEPSLIASDIRALGFTLCQLLSKKIDNALISSKALPQPFDEIVRGCTQRGWGLRQVERVLDGLPAEEISAVPAPTPIMRTETIRALPERDVPMGNHVKWISGAAAVGIIAAVLFVATSREKPVASAPPADKPKQAAVSTTVQTSSPVVAASIADVGRPAPPQDWRVIAYTYASKKDAEERARRVQTRWPDVRAEVFSPRGNSGPHLVALGGTMSRDEAMRLRTKLRAKGLPRDTFARNFK